jgi:hypothetical protein
VAKQIDQPGADRMSTRVWNFLSSELAPYVRAKDKKPLARQVREMKAMYREYGTLPYYYVTHGLYRKSHSEDVLEYIPVDMMIRFCNSLNAREGVKAASDKAAFSEVMRKAGLPAVGYFAILRNNGEIRNADGTVMEFQHFVRQLRRQCQEAFIKLRECSQGIAALRLPVAEIERMGWQQLHQRLWTAGVTAWSEYLVQPVVIQHPLLASLASTSVNTVRIDTYLAGETVHFNKAVLRVGNGIACTDNWASGGYIVKIDLDTGTLRGTGKIKSKFGKGEYPTHPRSGARFDGLVLPYWQELKSLVRAAAPVMLPLRSLGWDVALTSDGPLLIEVNHDYDIFLSQYACGGYRETPFGQALLRSKSGPIGSAVVQ